MLTDYQEAKDCLHQLRLYYTAENYEDILAQSKGLDHHQFLEKLLRAEAIEKKKRSIKLRLVQAKLGYYRRMIDYDWNWPKKINRNQIENQLNLDFMTNKANLILMGAQGLGKTMIAKNIGLNAVNRGYKVRFTTATSLVTDLLASGHNLEKDIKKYTSPHLLIIDELGYLSFELKAADLLFEVISRRYEENSTVLTTNLAFQDWPTIFPGAACVTALVDRLTHNAEIVKISGSSFRQNETAKKKKEKSNGK